MQTLYVEGKNWKHELNNFILAYRTTPHTTAKVPPCELLFNRKVKSQLPQLKRSRIVNKHKCARENIEAREWSNKEYQDKKRGVKEADIKVGDTVTCKQTKVDKRTPMFSPEKFIVVKRRGTTIYAENEELKRTRNISHFKKVRKDDSDDEIELEVNEGKPIELRRYTRQRKHVERYGQVLPSGLIE